MVFFALVGAVMGSGTVGKHTFLAPDALKQGSLGGQNVSYVCLGNVCRSAGAHIFSHALAAGIQGYKGCGTHLDSFAQLESAPEGTQAKEFLRTAMNDGKKQEAYVKKIEETLKRPLGDAEKKDFIRGLLEKKEAFRVSYLKKDSGESKLKPRTTIYVPTQELVGQLRTHITNRVGDRGDVEIKTMDEKNIEDDAWMTTQMLETYMLRKVLEAYPGTYESKEGPFSEHLVNRSMLGKYENLDSYQKLAESEAPETLTPQEVGFIYHDLTQPAQKRVVEKYGEAFEYNDGGMDIQEGLYKKRIFPRPGFFKDRKALIQFLRAEEDAEKKAVAQAIANGIETLVSDNVVPAYYDMSLQLLDVALKTLPKCQSA